MVTRARRVQWSCAVRTPARCLSVEGSVERWWCNRFCFLSRIFCCINRRFYSKKKGKYSPLWQHAEWIKGHKSSRHGGARRHDTSCSVEIKKDVENDWMRRIQGSLCKITCSFPGMILLPAARRSYHWKVKPRLVNTSL